MNRQQARNWLERLIRYCLWLLGAAILYVLVDFSVDIRPPAVHSSYRFSVGEIGLDRVRILRQDNLQILLIRRSAATNAELQRRVDGLQDPDSSDSRQPEFADNPLRSRTPEYFVSYAIGTDLGCGLEIEVKRVREICGKASYDFAGRALKGDVEFPNLPIPDYKFSNDFNTLTIWP